MPKVSVIIPTYNQAKFIDETIASVVSQTYLDLEILVLDDCSTDGAQAVIEAWARRDNRVIPMLSERNLGFSANVNRGLTAARGEFIAKLDGDDLMLPHKIATQVDFLEKNPQYMLTHHNMEAFDSDTGNKLYLLSDKAVLAKKPGDFCFYTDWFFSNKMVYFVYSSVVARTNYLTQHLWDTRVPYKNEILHLIENYATMPTGKWHVFNEPMGRYRILSNSMSRKKKEATFMLQENNVMCAIALAKYPALFNQLLSKKNYYLFIHLLYNNLPQNQIYNYRKLFLKEAGVFCFIYLLFCRFLVKTRTIGVYSSVTRFIKKTI